MPPNRFPTWWIKRFACLLYCPVALRAVDTKDSTNYAMQVDLQMIEEETGFANVEEMLESRKGRYGDVCKLQAGKFMSTIGNSNGERSGGMSIGLEINELECLVHEMNLKRLVCVAAQ
eukprot:scaffold3057_cov152-Alexandrium_tamarense.AAC.1